MIDTIEGSKMELTINACGSRFKLLKKTYQASLSMIVGAPGHTAFEFITPEPEENYVSGKPCELEFTL